MCGVRRGLSAAAAATLIGALGACSSAPPSPQPTPTVTAHQADRDRLAGLAAAAKDRRYVATYTLSVANRPDRTITVAIATDGSWVVPGGALSGLADIAIFRSSDGLFQCALGPAATAARTGLPPVTPGCAAVTRLGPTTDPQVQHIFTDWIDPLVDRAAALSVAATQPLGGADGSCFSIESTSAALAPPLDPGIYCYTNDGVLTAARVGFGTLVLSGAVQAAPATVAMPARVVTRAPLPLTAPASPPSSASASGSPRR
jgi:hypothetical protein